jgi:Phosphoenolpyruvate phosphomutase
MLPIQNTNMAKKTSALRAYLKAGTFLHMPAVYDPLGARLVEQAGFEAAYVGGYVTGGSQAITEPLLTMTEQVDVAEAVASSIDIPVVADAVGADLIKAKAEFLRSAQIGNHGPVLRTFCLVRFPLLQRPGCKTVVREPQVGISHNGTASNISKFRGSSAALLPSLLERMRKTWTRARRLARGKQLGQAPTAILGPGWTWC